MLVKIVAFGLAGSLFAAAAAQAQSFPSKPITIVVPTSPGGVTDIIARLVAQRFTAAWGQQAIVENRGGSNHVVGVAMVGRAPPDGHTLMVAGETVVVINPMLSGNKLPYDADQFAPITGLIRINQAVLATPSLPANSIAELIALAKQKPGEITYGDPGVGSSGHVNMALLENMAGIKLTAVHYRGSTPVLNDLIGGHISLTSVALSVSVPPYREGRAKILATGSLKRLPETPELPTTAETVPGYEAVTWFGLFTTAGTPRDVIDKINAEVRALFAEPSFRDRVMVPNMFEPMVSSPDEFAEQIKRDRVKWGTVLRDANIRID